jgi:large subunit ribosomal protein L13
MPRQTTLAKTNQIEPQWRHVDADGKVLGRIATEIASALMGKHRPEYTPYVLTGDVVIVTNAEKVEMTGRKLDQKFRETYSRYPSGRRVVSYRTVLAKHPERLIEDAVKTMLPKGRLGDAMYRRLKVYAGPTHPHQAQQPQPL